MKVLRRDAFLALPAGVIFAKGKPWYFETPHVKGETIHFDGKAIDFMHRDLVQISSHGSSDLFERLDEMLETGASYPLNESDGRDGCFDDEDLFLIYEAADLDQMQAAVEEARDAILGLPSGITHVEALRAFTRAGKEVFGQKDVE